MSLYTKCPKCHSEIQFDAPENMDSLPEGYKHRILCPGCGATIGVHLTKPVAVIKPATETTEPEENYDYAEEYVEQTAKKKSGIGRNICIMVISLLFIVLNVIGYLCMQEKINVEYLNASAGFGGIVAFDTLINDIDVVKAIFEASVGEGIITIVLPMLLFVLSGVTFIVALISAIGKKYSRVYNLIAGILIGGSAIVATFSEYLIALAEKLDPSFTEFGKALATKEGAILIAGGALGLLLIVLVCVFLIPLGKKEVVEEEAEDEVAEDIA